MSVALTIEIRDGATPWLAELGRRLTAAHLKF